MPQAPGVSPGVARARRRLDEAPERQATLAELAALAGTSRFQLLRGLRRTAEADGTFCYTFFKGVGVKPPLC